jgi:hypothetical protein
LPYFSLAFDAPMTATVPDAAGIPLF